MLKQFVHNYGKLMACAFGVLCAMLVYQEYRQDVLAYSLDLVGDRLAAMASDEKDKSTIEQMYKAFKEQVLAQEVAPDQVEQVAANILNLNQQGATVTSEQVMAMLEEPKVVLTDFSLPEPSVTPIPPERFEELGEKLKTLCEFDDRFQEAAKASSTSVQELRKHVHYEGRDGLRVNVDMALRKHFPEEKFRLIHEELRGLERKTLAVWRENIADSLRVIRIKVREDLAALADSSFEQALEANIRNQLKHLKALEKLSEFDYHFDEEKLQKMIERRIQRAQERRDETERRRPPPTSQEPPRRIEIFHPPPTNKKL